MPPSARRIGILAGGGSIPREIADSVAARRVPVFVVTLSGEADRSFAPHPTAEVNWGQIGRMVSLFRARGTTDIVIVGRVTRPDLSKVRPDLGLVMALPLIWRILRAGGDDAVLREVIAFFESKGLRVVGPSDVAPELVVGRGGLGHERPDPNDVADIQLGLDVVAQLGPLDIGQGVVVSGGRIAAIEGVEGTDRMLQRVAALRRVASGETPHPAHARRGVLIKRPKPGQEMRIDLPAIGPDTVTGAAEAGLKGIAVLEGRTIAAERAELVRRADALRLFVEGIPEPAAGPAPPAPAVTVALRLVSGGKLSAEAEASAIKGVRVVTALAPYAVGQAAVVVRRHVLAVEADEGSLALLGRVADLRQWGESKRKRRGVAVIRSGAESGVRAIEAAARAGLEGVVIVAPMAQAAVTSALAEQSGAASRLGMFLATAAVAVREPHHA